MLTLKFNQELKENLFPRNNKFYYNDEDLSPLKSVRFSPSIREKPFIMTANPFLHRNGLLHTSTSHPFAGRAIDMKRLKEVFDTSPVLMSVKLFSEYYFIGKGFFAKVPLPSRTSANDATLDILFCVTAISGRIVTSPHELKIYLNREMYTDKYKRVMAVIKPYMSAHDGDIVVTKSINDYLLYKFQFPLLKDINERAAFDDNMTEFFFRSLKWSEWRKEEDIRINEELERAYKIKQKEDRILKIQEDTMAVLSAEGRRVNSLAVDEVFIEGGNEGTELPDIGEAIMNIVYDQQEAIITEEEQVHSFPPMDTLEQQEVLESQEIGSIPIQESQQPLSHIPQQQEVGEPQSLSQEQQELLEQLRAFRLTPDLEASTITATTSGQTPQPQQGEHVSEEEIMRLMNAFAIQPPSTVEYSVAYDPSTTLVTDRPNLRSGSGGGTIENTIEVDNVNEDEVEEEENEDYGDEGDNDEDSEDRIHSENEEDEFDEETEFVLVESNEPTTGPGLVRTEEDLDNDPDAYEEAEIVHSGN